MQTQDAPAGRKSGSVMMVAVVFLAIAALALISIMVATGNYSRVSFDAHEYERAFELADAGVRAALNDLNGGRNGVIDQTRARQFFANPDAFRAPNWGFTTSVTNLAGGLRRILAQGTFGHATATVTADASLNQTAQTIHALYAHAIYAGNSSRSTNYVLQIGGTGSGADFVIGDVYSGNNLALSGTAKLRLPESFIDANSNGIFDEGEVRTDSSVSQIFTQALTLAQYNAYTSSVDRANVYGNGLFDIGEAFVDQVGNGVYDPGEGFTDVDGDGQYGFGEPFTDLDGDGSYDTGEEFVDHGNGQYDAGEPFDDLNGNGRRDRREPYEDRGDGTYSTGETFVDRNGVYDAGDTFFDDRNGRYDYGVTVEGAVTGMPSPGPGQLPVTGNDEQISPPDLSIMYYDRPSSGGAPANAAADWGHDVDVAAASFDSGGRVMSTSDPRHIFVKNPNNRTYTKVTGRNDYFLEDPSDNSYGNSHQFLNVRSNGNDKVYFIDGNLYIHNPDTYDFMFRQPGTKITIVAKGNITISDELWYNGGKTNARDSLALIAMKASGVTNSGNIYLGDAQFGTGGDVHAMLYAENNFVDNNLNTANQPYLSVFGNMTAGNQVNINRTGTSRTRLDVTLDERIVARRNLPPGLPQALAGERSISVTGAWAVVRGSWNTHSPLR